MNAAPQHLIDMLSLGSLYATIAIGVALVFSIMGLVNFAHGELIMIGAYAMVFLGGVNVAFLILAAVIASALAAIIMERVAFRPLREADSTTLLIASFSMSFLLQNTAILIAGALPRAVQLPPVFSGFSNVGPLRVSNVTLLTLTISLLSLAILGMFLTKTGLGVDMRAAAENFRMARLLGVKANRVIAVGFAISGGLAGLAAVLIAATRGTAHPTMGLSPVLAGFVGAVIGGMGNLRAAALGGMVLGSLTVLLDVVLPAEVRVFRDAVLFGVVFVILLVRPSGLWPAASTSIRV